MLRRLHVHVIAVRLPAPDAQSSEVGDLLPWADPYIAALLRRLVQDDGQEPTAAELLAGLEDEPWDALEEDAFVPPEEEQLSVLRPVIGGYPLLDAPPPSDTRYASDGEPAPSDTMRRPR